jgi:hypothetical protein
VLPKEGETVHPTIAEQLVKTTTRDRLDRAAAGRRAREGREERPAARPSARHTSLHAIAPLLFDVAIPAALYYLLSGVGVSNTQALLAGGFVPFARSARSLMRERRADYLAVMMAALFLVSLILVAFTGSAKLVLAKESFGTALIGLWCLGTAWARRPMTFYTARPLLTKGRPEALRCWDRLAERSAEFRSIQRRLALFWGAGLLVEAAVRVAIVEHYSVHTAAGLVHVAGFSIVLALCLLSGPLGGLRLQRMLTAAVAAAEGESAHPSREERQQWARTDSRPSKHAA